MTQGQIATQRRHVVLGGLAAIAIFVVGSQYFPMGSTARHAWVDIGWIIADALGALACFAASRRATRPSLRFAWRAFTAAMALWTLAAAIWAWNELALAHYTPFPSMTDYLGWVGGIAMLVGVFAYRLDDVSVAMTLRQLADLGLMAASMIGLAVELLYPYVASTTAPAHHVAAALATPSLGLIVLGFGILCISLRRLGARRRVLGLILLGMAALTVVTVLYTNALLGGTYRAGAWMDSIWVAGMLVVGWAALEERWIGADERADEDPPARWMVQVPIVMAAAWMTSVVLLAPDHGDALLPVRAGSLAANVVAMIVRVWANNRLAIELRRRVAEEESRRWRLEAQLMRAQKLEALGTLAGSIAHDVNNVLAATGASLHLARRRLTRGEDACAELEEAERVIQRAAGVTDRLLGLANNRSQRRRSVDVGQIVEQVAALLGKVMPAGMVVRREVTPGLPPITVDPVGLEHALLNLGLNARDALRDGGGHTITLVARLGDDPAQVVLEVADDGPGIAADVLPRLFEPFFTTKPDGMGTGLGLAMVDAFAGANGVAVAVESRPGAGARFRLSAPSGAGG
ncbi:MAG TPA: ATP-binding protein [Kofleriaceae bacterium]|nr:ATP-binding protein [Kofleriaceae bacterium]